MALRSAAAPLLGLRKSLTEKGDTGEILSAVADFLADSFGADHVVVALKNRVNLEIAVPERSRGSQVRRVFSKNTSGGPTSLFDLQDQSLCFGENALSLPLIINDTSRCLGPSELLTVLRSQRVRSLALWPVYFGKRLAGWIELYFLKRYFHFRNEDLSFLQSVSENAGQILQNLGSPPKSRMTKEPARLPESAVIPFQAERLIEHANLICIRTDKHRRIVEVHGDTLSILGFDHQELLADPNAWSSFIHSEDLRLLAKATKIETQAPANIDQEVRVLNRRTGEMRWYLIKAVPLIMGAGEISGWEGFGFDITEKKAAEEALLSQSKRIEALYEVSRALHGNRDPAVLTLKGLRALISATGSDSGFGCFLDSATGQLDIVAAEGLSARYLEQAAQTIKGACLIRNSIDQKQGVILDNIQRDSRAAVALAKLEGLRSTIMMPLIFEDQVLGAIAIYCKRSSRYSGADFDLVEAACRQIALALRQAETYAAEKRQASSLGALYRLSHELSRFLTPREIVEHAFPIIQSEFVFKRIWLGVLNEQGTHVVGQGGYGPGIRGRLVNIQIELDLRHDFFDEAIRTKQPVIIEAGTLMECSGLNRIMNRLKPGALVIVPLVSLGQVVGVLVVEPTSPTAFFAQRKLPLLVSMAGEIATVVLARRFEARMADAAKMRMATLLASGVAHNFNNLLQAVMGQASLIEMQSGAGPLSTAARTIIDAAGKGASLIKQLLNFTVQGSHDRREVEAHEFFAESKTFYESVLGAAVRMEINLDQELPKVVVDYNQLQQVMANLLVNAKEAVASKERAYVKIEAHQVRIRSGEVHPELAPGLFLRIDVEDNGVGMDTDKQARCFEPFFTTKNVDAGTGLGFQGSGLGLSSAYSVVRQHDGIITVRSQLGQGSVFSLYLPAAVERHDLLTSSAANGARLATDEAMIIDHDIAQSHALIAMLSAYGVNARVYANSEEAVEYLRRHRDVVKLIFLDIDRSGYNILSFVRLLRVENKDLGVIASCIDVERWNNFLRPSEKVKVLAKPVGGRALREAVEELVPDSRLALVKNQDDKDEVEAQKGSTALASTWVKGNSITE